MPDTGPASIAELRGGLAATVSSLLAELEGLGRIISDARAEVAALRSDDVAEAAIPVATDELAAIVSHTAQATHEILDSCEKLEALKPSDAAVAQALAEQTTRIYEACAFQDITGQRIAKVVAALQTIESRIGRARAGVAPGAAAAAPASQPSLLNGPQLPGAGISQSDIDALFD